jgi:nucleoid-associated protein YgaU
MRKGNIAIISLLLAGIFFSTAWAQEKKYTEEEALKLIEQYNARESTAKAKIAKEDSRIDALRADIAKLDDEIASLESSIVELKTPPKKEWDIYVVKSGDWLSKLAEYPEVYGKGNYCRWRDIYKANKDLIKDPDLIYPEWKLKIPRP